MLVLHRVMRMRLKAAKRSESPAALLEQLKCIHQQTAQTTDGKTLFAALELGPAHTRRPHQARFVVCVSHHVFDEIKDLRSASVELEKPNSSCKACNLSMPNCKASMPKLLCCKRRA